MTRESEQGREDTEATLKRRGLLRLGTIGTAITGASALSILTGGESYAASRTSTVPISSTVLYSDDPSAIYANVVNAKCSKYGIVGDGVTDDTDAIQTLLAGVGPNTTVHFSAGTYRHRNIVVTGKNNLALVGDGAVFVATTRSQRYLSFVNCTDLTVRGITSKGAVSTTRQGPTRGISLEGCGRYLVTGCHVYCTEGVGIYSGAGCYDGRIIGNLVHDTLADGIHTTGASKRIVVSGNTIRDSGDDAVAVVSYKSDAAGPCEDVTITGNLIWHSHSRGLAVVGGKGITLSGNTVREPKNAGIYIAFESVFATQAVQDVSVVGNTIVGANTFDNPTINAAGIQIVGDGGMSTPVTGITICGNTVEGSRWHGILIGNTGVGCYGVTLTDNNIRNSGKHGVMAQAVQDILVNGNMIDTAGEAGIYCNDTRGLLSITGNIVREPNRASLSTATRGIFAGTPSLTRGVITGNVVFDSTASTAQPLDLSTGVNLSVYGNAVGGNIVNFPATSGLPFIAPGSAVLCGAFETSGLGGGKGVVGVRNAATLPTTNPHNGGILYSDSGAARWRTPNGTISTISGDVMSVSGNYIVLVSDRTILATAGATGITVTLPAAVKGSRFEIKKIDSGLGAVTIATTASQTIDGATMKALVKQYERISVVSNGNSWSVI